MQRFSQNDMIDARCEFQMERERVRERGRLAPTNNNISEAGNGRQERAQVKG